MSKWDESRQPADDLQKAHDKIVGDTKKIKVEEAEIVVHGTVEKPYFEIKYREVGSKHYNIGYSSYDLVNVFGWLESEFDIVGKRTKREKKDYSAYCNLNDEDMMNDCWGCSRFCFPIGCMVGEDGEGRAEGMSDKEFHEFIESDVLTFDTKMSICECCEKKMMCTQLHNASCSILRRKVEDIYKQINNK